MQEGKGKDKTKNKRKIIMQTICDECKCQVKEVGRLVNVKYGGFTQKVCKNCRKKLKISYR